MLSSVFPAVKFNPELYYALLDDLREDYFIGGVTRICRETKELYPNTNLVALIRDNADSFRLEKMKQKQGVEFKKLGHDEKVNEELAEKNRKEFNELKDKLAAEKGVK